MKEIFTYQNIFNAYRKMKNYYYFDTNTLAVRYKISEFEAQMGITAATTNAELVEKLLAAFKPLYEVLNAEKPLERLSSLGPIGYTIMPKETSSCDHGKDFGNYITNAIAEEAVVVDKCNFIIDAPIELLVISVLWIEFVGVKLYACIGKDSYAYQLNATKDVEERWSLNNGLNLFKPYYVGYQDWRDNAMKEANRLLDSGNDVTILGLDIKRYFYSVRVSLGQMMRSYWNEKLEPLTEQVNLLNSLLQEIHLQYSKLINDMLEWAVTDEDLNAGYSLLPVGLPSSGILGNLLLSEFDIDVWDRVCPVYYGRYVDDMLFVFSNRFVDNYSPNPVAKFVSAYFEEAGILSKNENSDFKIETLPAGNSSVLVIQQGKLVLEHFLSKGSHAAIDIFLKDLARQRSEFRFLPDEDNISDEFDMEAYKLFYADSSHKFRNIQGLKTDKFGASKYLAKQIFLSKLSELDNLEMMKKGKKKTANQLLNFFKGKTAIEMYSLWEKVATYFIINHDLSSLSRFYYCLLQEIMNLQISDERSKVDVSELREHLSQLLNWSVSLPLALNPTSIDKETRYFKNLAVKNKLKKDAVLFRHANMFKHNYLAVLGVNYTSCLFDDSCSLFSVSELKGLEIKQEICSLSPRFIRFEELNLIEINSRVKNLVYTNDTKSTLTLDIDFNALLDKYKTVNTEWQTLLLKNEKCESTWIEDFVKFESQNVEEQNQIQYISLYDKEEQKSLYGVDKRVAIANIRVCEQDFMHIVKRKREMLDNERRRTLCKIINEAYKEKADILVMPELMVPFSWLGFLVSQAVHTNMAIVTGVEYVIGEDNVILNTVATILPVQTQYMKTCVTHLRIKNFYSPKEKIILEGYHYKLPQLQHPQYTLFHWRKSYFSVYNCFELADIHSRSLFQSMADFLIAVEYNRDVHYFSDVTSSWARDVHCFIVQVNTAQYGDSKILMPSRSDFKTLLNVKGGENPVVMLSTLPIRKLRDFQIADYQVQASDMEFKFTPPHFNYHNVVKKIKDEELWQK